MTLSKEGQAFAQQSVVFLEKRPHIVNCNRWDTVRVKSPSLALVTTILMTNECTQHVVTLGTQRSDRLLLKAFNSDCTRYPASVKNTRGYAGN